MLIYVRKREEWDGKREEKKARICRRRYKEASKAKSNI